MESLEELERWDAYRAWMRKYLKRLSGEPEAFYVSKSRIDFQIGEKAWKGHAVLLGKKSRKLSQKLRQEGCLFLEGRCTSDGKRVSIEGFGDKHAIGAERLFRKLKLGFEIVGVGGGEPEDDPLEARWKERRAESFPRIKTALASDRPDVDALKQRARPMLAAEKRGDWAGALEALEAVLVLVDGDDATGRREHPLSAEENERLAELSPDRLAEIDLTQRDPNELFGDDYMDELTTTRIPGAGDPDLKEIMRQLAKGAHGAKRERLIAALAPIVEADAKALDVDYGRFLVLRDQQAAIAKRKGKEPSPDLAEDLHGEFMGSQPQLLFGKVVGDAFGIHPVFAALLSPTGGLVGPGNTAVQMDDDDPTGYHGIVHDAAGYLYNYHGEGPGYDYLDREERDTGHALTGQQSGMRYWHEKLDPGLETTIKTELIDTLAAGYDTYQEAAEAYREGRKGLEEFQVEAEKALRGTRERVARELDRGLETAGEALDETRSDAERIAVEFGDAVDDAKETIRRSAVENYDEATEALDDVRDEARERLEAAWDYVWS